MDLDATTVATPPCETNQVNNNSKNLVDVRWRTSTYVNVRRRTSTYVDVRQRTSTYVDVRRRTSTYVDVSRRTSTYVDVRRRTPTHVDVGNIFRRKSTSKRHYVASGLLTILRCAGDQFVILTLKELIIRLLVSAAFDSRHTVRHALLL